MKFICNSIHSKLNSRTLVLLFLVLMTGINFCKAQNPSTGQLRGTVLEGGGGIPGVIILLEGTKYYTTSDIDGKFELSKIPVGNYKVLISALGFEKKTIDVKIIEKSTLDLGEIVLQEPKQLEEVVITAEMKNTEAKAINMTKNSTKLVTIVSADGIAKLPNKNAADVVARIPGANVQRNKGEGSMISLRGTPMDWTATFINGDRLPVADEENVTRSFEFEVLPADMIDYVIVSRTNTPDVESDNIGGNINFLTRAAVDKQTFRMNIAGGYNPLANKPIGTFNFLYGNASKNKKFKYVVNGSYFGRNYATDAMKLIYGNNYNHSLSRLELRRYDGVRQTIGGNASAEYAFNDKFKIGTHVIYGTMIDNKYQKRQSFNWYDGSGSRIRLYNIHGILKRQLYGADIFSEYKINSRLNLKARVASYDNQFKYGPFPFKNKSDFRNGYVSVEFISPLLSFLDLSNTDLWGNAVDQNYYDPFPGKYISFDEPYGNGDPSTNIQPKYNTLIGQQPVKASDFEFYQVYSELNQTRETDKIIGQFDLEYKLNNSLRFQVGAKYRDKEGVRKISLHEWFQDFSSGITTPYYLNEFETDEKFSSTKGGFLKEYGANYENQLFPFFSQQQLNDFLSDSRLKLREDAMGPNNPKYRYWLGSSYEYTEKQQMAYLLGEYNTKKFNVLAGLRTENTLLYMKSDTMEDYIDGSGNIIIISSPRSFNRSYISWLPSLNTTFFIKEDNNLRFAVSRTMHRPNFEQTKPGFAVNKQTELVQIYGNPELKPTYAINLDLSFEHFWAAKGMWSIGVYYKNVKDHIVTASYIRPPDASDPFGFFQVKKYLNASDAYVAGVEAVFIRKFDFLKGFWNGFGINSNITLSTSQMTVPGRPQGQAMSEQTPLLFNVALIYEKYNITARTALGFNGRHLKELNLATAGSLGYLHQNDDFDVFMDKYYNLDFQISYSFKKYYSLYFEGSNLLNYAEKKYIGRPWRTLRHEFYRQRFQVGFRIEI